MMRFTHAPGHAMAGFSKLGYHDATYDEDGGQGTAIETLTPGQASNPGVLLMIAIVILVVMMAGDES